MRRVFAIGLSTILVAWAAPGRAQGIIVDHTSLPLFDQIPNEYLVAAANLPMMFVDRSVGANISDGLTCLQYDSERAAPNSCRRVNHIVPQFSSPMSALSWSRFGGYNRSNWNYFSWPGTGIDPELPCGLRADSWFQKFECFLRFVNANPPTYTVISFEFSYLEVDDSSDIAARGTGFFARQPNRVDVDDLEAFQRSHPWLITLLQTTNLARSIGTRVSTTFNEQMREYAREHNSFLLDVADIESHDPSGQPCFDNRDGVPYSAGNASEDYRDDGEDLPALCPHYTREADGGHLGNPDVGKIRLAKAFWIAMARIAGWNPPVPPSLSKPRSVRP